MQTQLAIAGPLGFGNKKLIADSAALSDEIGRMLVGLHRVLQRPKPSTWSLVPGPCSSIFAHYVAGVVPFAASKSRFPRYASGILKLIPKTDESTAVKE